MKKKSSLVLDRAIFILICCLPILVIIAFQKDLYNCFWIPKNTVFLALFILATILGFFAWSKNKAIFARLNNSLVYAVLAFDTALILSTIFSNDPVISFWGSYWRQMGLVVMLPLSWIVLFSILVFDKWEKTECFQRFIMFFGGAYSLVGLLQKFGVPVLGLRVLYKRSSGFQGNPDFFAPTMVLMLFPTLAICVSDLMRRRWRMAICGGISALLQVSVIFASMTRGSWLALLFGLGIFLLILALILIKRHKKAFVIGVVAAIIVFPTLFILVGFVMPKPSRGREDAFDKLKTIIEMKSKSGQTHQRLLLWRDTLRLCLDNFKRGDLFGTGLEYFYKPFLRYKSLDLAQIEKSINYDNPHNNFLGLLTKTGITGFITYLAIFALVCYHYWRCFRSEMTLGVDRKLILTGFFVAVLAYFVNLIFIFETISSSLIFFIFVGIIAASSPRNPSLETKRDNSWNTKVWAVAALGMGIFAVLGFYHNLFLIRADWHYERGRSLLIKHNMDVDRIERAIKDLRIAHKLNPHESFYSHELILALGLEAKALLNKNDIKRADSFYAESLSLGRKIEKTSWSPDVLYLTLGSNAFRVGDTHGAVQLLERALSYDRWCLAAHKVLGLIYYYQYKKSRDPRLLAKAFSHPFAISQILRNNPYWDMAALDETFTYGFELYEKERNPRVLRALVETFTIYAKCYFSSNRNAKMLKIVRGTAYEKIVDAAILYSHSLQYIRDKDSSVEKKRKKLEKTMRDIRALDVECPVVNEYLVALEKRRNEL